MSLGTLLTLQYLFSNPNQILGIWIAVSAPMGILAYILTPALSPDFDVDPLGAAGTRYK